MKREQTSPGSVLVVDDEQGMRDMVADVLATAGHEVRTASSAQAALELLGAGEFELVLSDVRMPGVGGMELLKRIRERWPAIPVVLLTAYGSIPQAVEAIHDGAFDFIEKPVRSPAALRATVRRALEAGRKEAGESGPGQGPGPGQAGGGKTDAGPREASRIEEDRGFVCEDPVSRELGRTLELVARRDVTVLLTGESGTGKEVASRRIHAHSRRAGGPFVAVNAAAIPATLLEDQLFGHARGAFTGAQTDRKGLFEAADGGTLLLDEIGEMNAELQVKLLRVLETHAFQRLGDTVLRQVDVRLIAATNRDLRASVASGSFRQDLWWRLSVFPVRIPPLRERRADIAPLARHFVEAISRASGTAAPELSPESVRALEAAPWPGNVRELRNAIERAMVMAPGSRIEPVHLMLESGQEGASGQSGTLRQMEREAISAALRSAGGNRRKAAAALGISLRNLQYKIKEFGLGSTR